MVRGRLHLDSHESAVESAAAQRCLDLQDKFLSMWNGDLRSHRPYHICSVLSDGRLCCDSEEEARAKFFAVGVEAGVLLDASDSPPSINRWGTCTQVLSHVVAACFFTTHWGKVQLQLFPSGSRQL